jgi:hypothetical protein
VGRDTARRCGFVRLAAQTELPARPAGYHLNQLPK